MNKIDEANIYLNKLYLKQNKLNAHIYSPFVENELANIEKKKNNKEKAIYYLLEAVKNTRRMKANDLVKVNYDLMKLYEKVGNEDQESEYLEKCKNVKDTKDSLYKKMCDEL